MDQLKRIRCWGEMETDGDDCRKPKLDVISHC
jgi:hypothetical protein